MLKGIPSVLSPELLKIMMEMGHGDELVLADANFPSASHSQRLIRSDGIDIPRLLDSILRFFPLDKHVDIPVILMDVPTELTRPKIWDEYQSIIEQHHEEIGSGHFEFKRIERFEFYERAKKSYAIIATGEKSLYANIILKKGVVEE